MFYKDFTTYSYAYTGEETPRPLNVGWLDPAETFERGETTEEFKERLFLFCKIRIEETRGYHECPFCRCENQILEERNGVALRLGSAEIRVAGADGKVYAAPNLIFHYVVRHQYRPPEEFIRAVQSSSGSTLTNGKGSVL